MYTAGRACSTPPSLKVATAAGDVARSTEGLPIPPGRPESTSTSSPAMWATAAAAAGAVAATDGGMPSTTVRIVPHSACPNRVLAWDDGPFQSDQNYRIHAQVSNDCQSLRRTLRPHGADPRASSSASLCSQPHSSRLFSADFVYFFLQPMCTAHLRPPLQLGRGRARLKADP